MQHDTAFQISASNIRFGKGVRAEVGMDLEELQIRRTLLVIDPALSDLPNGLAAMGYTSEDVPALVESTLPQHRVTKLSAVPAGEGTLSRLSAESMTIWEA